LAAIQFIPTGAERNPSETAPADLPEGVAPILQRSCFDCHSRRTRWPWYSRVAPSSWLVAYHVAEGREHLDFSAWEDLSAAKKTHALESIREVMDQGEMPPRSYLWIHRDAKLAPEDREALRRWLESQGVAPSRAGDD
jgi:hypothetical protein